MKVILTAILALISLVFVNATTQLNGWGQIEQAFMAGQPFNIVVEYSLCTGQKSCSICDYISLNSTNLISPITSISETADKDQIDIASLQQFSTIPEFASAGYKQNIVTEVVLKPQTCQPWVPCPTVAIVQVYSLDNKYAYSEVYTCDVGVSLNIFSNLPSQEKS